MSKKSFDILSPLSIIPKFGPKRIEALASVDLKTIEDLLYNFPYSYLDKSNPIPLNSLQPYLNTTIAVTGTISHIRRGHHRSAPSIVTLSDTYNNSIQLVWYQGFRYIENTLQIGTQILAVGKLSYYQGYQIAHPSIEQTTQPTIPIEPRYSMRSCFKEARISQRLLREALQWIFKNLQHYPIILPEHLENRYALPSLEIALKEIHFPSSLATLSTYYQRVKTEELYTFALQLRWRKRAFSLPGITFSSRQLQQKFIQGLPFALTPGQKEVINHINSISQSNKRLHGLLQGDVGCGKTVTAFITLLPALESGYQVLWLTPTELLAQQTYLLIQQWLTPFSISHSLLTAHTPTPEKRDIYRQCTLGTLSCIVGTHALLNTSLRFARVGAIVIDEQHRFGTKQRAHLQEIAPQADVLMLSATPIPQSLAQTLFSDLQLFTIPSLPSQRKPIITKLVPPAKEQNLITYLRNNKTTFSKVFWVVPRIESSEEDSSILASIESRLQALKASSHPQSVAVIHGQQSLKEQQEQFSLFTDGPAQFLVATTIIEVGIHIPEATVIVIENPEQFGLAQLHQIRGRVGRSATQSYAYLLYSSSLQQVAFERLESFCRAKDGFEIAQLDLTLRKSGEILGQRQSGKSELRFSNILEEIELFKELQNEVESLMKKE